MKGKNPPQANPFSISPLSVGLTIVNVLDRRQLPDVRATFEHCAVTRSKKLGIPMPKVDLIASFYSGSPRHVEQAKLLAAANPSAKRQTKHEYKVCGTRDGFVWTSNEGRCAILPSIESIQGLMTMEQTATAPLGADELDGLFRIRSAATLAKTRVMMFLACPDGSDKTGLDQICDEYIEVSPCEADPNTYTAFAVDCVGLPDLHILGHGKIMCTIRIDGGRFRRSYAPFIAEDLDTRIMWFLRGQGHTFEGIGEIMDCDKSTVMRRLQELPPPMEKKMPDDWLKDYMDISKYYKATKREEEEERKDRETEAQEEQEELEELGEQMKIIKHRNMSR